MNFHLAFFFQKFNCQYKILIEGIEFRELFFQNNTIKNYFVGFPEIVFLNGTYKLLKFNGIVYLFLTFGRRFS